MCYCTYSRHRLKVRTNFLISFVEENFQICNYQYHQEPTYPQSTTLITYVFLSSIKNDYVHQTYRYTPIFVMSPYSYQSSSLPIQATISFFTNSSLFVTRVQSVLEFQRKTSIFSRLNQTEKPFCPMLPQPPVSKSLFQCKATFYLLKQQ